jgi:hypothetical protein
MPWAYWLQTPLLQLLWTMTHGKAVPVVDARKLLIVESMACSVLNKAAVPTAHPRLHSYGLGQAATGKAGAAGDMLMRALLQRVGTGPAGSLHNATRCTVLLVAGRPCATWCIVWRAVVRL